MFAAKPTRRRIRPLEVELLDNRDLPSTLITLPHNDGVIVQVRAVEPMNLTMNEVVEPMNLTNNENITYWPSR